MYIYIYNVYKKIKEIGSFLKPPKLPFPSISHPLATIFSRWRENVPATFEGTETDQINGAWRIIITWSNFNFWIHPQCQLTTLNTTNCLVLGRRFSFSCRGYCQFPCNCFGGVNHWRDGNTSKRGWIPITPNHDSYFLAAWSLLLKLIRFCINPLRTLMFARWCKSLRNPEISVDRCLTIFE